jgi:hypothetical protein
VNSDFSETYTYLIFTVGSYRVAGQKSLSVLRVEAPSWNIPNGRAGPSWLFLGLPDDDASS